MRSRPGAVLCGLLLVGVGLAVPAGAAPVSVPTGTLDPTFDGDGLLDLPAEQPFMVASIGKLAVAADGTTLVGSSKYDGQYTTVLSKLDSTGNLDPAFGELGNLILYQGTTLGTGVSGLAATSDGAAIVAYGGVPGALERRTADGSLDATFGVGGRRTDLAGASSIAVTPDGIVLVHGGNLRRITDQGQDDAAFGVNGTAALPRNVIGVAVLTDGRLVAAMPSSSPADDAIIVVTTAGQPDASFGPDPGNPGQAAIDVTPDRDAIDGVTAGPGGAVLVSTTHFGGLSAGTVYAAGFTASGQLDPSFGSGGVTLLHDSPAKQPFAGAPVSRADGSLAVAIGQLGVGQDRVIELGGDGAVSRETLIEGGDTAFRPMALDAAGALLVPEYTVTGSGTSSLRRLTSLGFDPTYSGDGFAFVGFLGTAVGYAGPEVVLSDGSILTPVKSGSQADLWRHWPDGTPVATFGDGGRVRLPTREDASGLVRAAAEPATGLFYAAYSYGDGPSHVARLLPDGALDPSWGDAGVVSLESMLDLTGTLTIVPSPAGLFVVGFVWDVGSHRNDTKVVRLDAAGALDPTFGDGGVATITRADGLAIPFNALADDAGGLLLVVFTNLVRLDPQGVLDVTFGTGGAYELPSFVGGCNSASLTKAPGPSAVIYLATQVPVDCADPSPPTTVVALDGEAHPVAAFGGQTSVTFEGGQTLYGMAVDPSHRIVLSFATQLVRLDAAGGLDSSFGSSGVALLPASVASARSLAVGASGVYLSGSSTSGGVTHPLVARIEDGAAVAPGAPTILWSATAGDGQATVSWTGPVFDGGAPITGYVVTPYVGFFPLAAVTFGSTSTTQTIVGLTNGVTYRFRLQAVNEAGTSSYSTVTNAVTPSPPAVPGAPTILRNATEGDGQATVSWTAPAEVGGAPVTGYVVTPYVGYFPLPSSTFASTATTQTVTGLKNGVTYRFRVQAVNDVGPSLFSKVTNAVTPSA